MDLAVFARSSLLTTIDTEDCEHCSTKKKGRRGIGLGSRFSQGFKTMAQYNNQAGALLLTSALLITLLAWLFLVWLKLRHIPGPFLPSISNFYRMRWVLTKQAHLIHQEFHQRYGDVVRLGPNMVSISDPSAIRTIYPMRKGFVKVSSVTVHNELWPFGTANLLSKICTIKSNFYAPLRPYTKKGGAIPNVFTAVDEDLHSKLKFPVAHLFSLSNVVAFEAPIDEVLCILSKQLDERFSGHGEIFDITEWLQFFAFDVMGTMTFSERYGFLEKGRDVGGMLSAIDRFMAQAAPMMQIPWLDRVLYKNHLADTFWPTAGTNIMKFVVNTIEERQKTSKERGSVNAISVDDKNDFLSGYIELQRHNPKIPPWSEHPP
ncbi:unnamed protein product [Penicillium salamii]|uniref:Uncharacterized protein n=1 Tax=Penicillium salamii TaxID=1612424 RepID=A0A9W4I509_9EURO|nr:unnamed protein product [Penicillium salamii]